MYHGAGVEIKVQVLRVGSPLHNGCQRSTQVVRHASTATAEPPHCSCRCCSEERQFTAVAVKYISLFGVMFHMVLVFSQSG